MDEKDGDDARHRLEEQERRNKRKASKQSKSEGQAERERQRREYRQKILKQHGGGSGSGSKRSKGKSDKSGAVFISAFQELFQQRATGFQVDFRFRNAPPRPPVGPTFAGRTLAGVLQERARTYQALNAVEVAHNWKLHSETDLGVPLAPSAMDLKSYENKKDENTTTKTLHPDDAALLDWKGSMGDTAAENMKKRKDRAKQQARLALAAGGGAASLASLSSPNRLNKLNPAISTEELRKQQRSDKKASRVLKEEMQTWMKKTTYLSNDYSRKVHDFKSLAQTKQQQVQDLHSKQLLMDKKRSAANIAKSFDLHESEAKTRKLLKHPTRKVDRSGKPLTPVSVYSVLPNVEEWGKSYTHVVIDKQPALAPEKLKSMPDAFLANVVRNENTTKMSCQMWIPADETGKDNNNENEDKEDNNSKDKRYEPVQAYDLAVIPLKENDAPHIHFSFALDRSNKDHFVARYVPIASRVNLSMGRPVKRSAVRRVGRRPVTAEELAEEEQRRAEVDEDLAQKHDLPSHSDEGERVANGNHSSRTTVNSKGNESDEGVDDFGDDDDDESVDEEVFGAGTKATVAEGLTTA